jgi:DNA-binding LacI/PurR family transcriptional regulator
MTMSEESAPRRTRPSMADVARAAGVAPVTVSRVSNGQSNVDPVTRQRVVESMRALGCRPNSAARALKSGRFNTMTFRTARVMRAAPSRRPRAAGLTPPSNVRGRRG